MAFEQQGFVRRGLSDTKTTLGKPAFWLTQLGAGTLGQVLFGVLGSSGFVLGVFAVILCYHLARAPFRQRDEMQAVLRSIHDRQRARLRIEGIRPGIGEPVGHGYSHIHQIFAVTVRNVGEQSLSRCRVRLIDMKPNAVGNLPRTLAPVYSSKDDRFELAPQEVQLLSLFWACPDDHESIFMRFAEKDGDERIPRQDYRFRIAAYAEVGRASMGEVRCEFEQGSVSPKFSFLEEMSEAELTSS